MVINKKKNCLKLSNSFLKGTKFGKNISKFTLIQIYLCVV